MFPPRARVVKNTFAVIAGLFKHTQALSRALLVDATRLDQHSQVLGRFNALSSTGFIVGPMIGGHLGDTSQGRTMLFVTVAVMFFFNAGECT